MSNTPSSSHTTRTERRRRWGRQRKERREKGAGDDLWVAWANVARSSTCQSTVQEACFQAGIHVLHVQEPAWTKKGRSAKAHEAWEEYRPVDTWDNEETRPKVLTYVRKNLKKTVLQPKQTRRDVLWIQVGGTTFVNVYRTPGEDGALEEVLAIQPSGRLVVGGDFNAGHEMWQPHRITAGRGGDLARWSRNLDMVYTGTPGEATHLEGNTLDLVFSNISFVETTTREDLMSGSDHSTLVTVLPGRYPEIPPPPRWVVSDAKEDDFARAVAHALRDWQPPVGLQAEEIDNWVEKLTNVLDEAVRAIGTPHREVGGPAVWWTDECAEAHTALLEAGRGLPPGRCPQQRQRLAAAVRKAKQNYWHRVIDGMKSDADLWKVAAWHKLGPKEFSPPLKTGDSEATTPMQKAEALVNQILKRFTADDDLREDPLENWNEEERRDGLNFCEDLTLEEVRRQTIGVSSTSPGVDGLTVRLLKMCWATVGPLLLGVFRCCLNRKHFPKPWKRAEIAFMMKVGKKDRTTFRSYRPIALLSVLGKGLERILAQRMAWAALETGILSPQHISALPKRAATDLLAAFVHDVEAAFDQNLVTLLITLDVQGAFDAVLFRRLLQRCRQMGWDIGWLLMMRSFLTGRQVRGRFDNATTSFTGVDCGTPQGSPWSPMIYLLYLAELFLRHPGLTFGYADDGSVRVSEKTPQLCARSGAIIVRDILSWGDQNKVVFAPEKCEAIYISRKIGRPQANPPIRVREDYVITPAPLPSRGCIPTVRWLGLYVDRKLRFKEHVRIRAQKALRAANHLRHLSRTVHGPPPEATRKAALACVYSSALYGAEAWYSGRRALNRQGKVVSTRLGHHIDVLQAPLKTVARAVVAGYRTTPIATVFRDAGLPDAELALEAVAWRMGRRIQTVDSSHPLAERATRRQNPKRLTPLELNARKHPETTRPTLVAPRYSSGCDIDPTGQLTKEEAASLFQEWHKEVLDWGHKHIVAFSDGSVGKDGKGYGYVVTQDGETLAEGKAGMHPISTIFDAEAVGAARCLQNAEKVIRDRGESPEEYQVTACVDNTGVIWCLRGTASLDSQWAFLDFQRRSKCFKEVNVKWCPGHTGIGGNERADVLAKEGQNAPMDPSSGTTHGGLKSLERKALMKKAGELWSQCENRLSKFYKEWRLSWQHDKCPQAVKVLARHQLHRYHSIRHGHGDYSWYHTKFRHEDAQLHCSCGARKTPKHIFYCDEAMRQFRKWPWPWEDRPRRKPRLRIQKDQLMKAIMARPELFAKLLKDLRFYEDICTR